MNFQIKALPAYHFQQLDQLSEEELTQAGVQRLLVDEQPGYPCRVSLVEAEVGEMVYLLTYTHHNTSSPYHASGPIFVRVGAKTAEPAINEIPLILQHRLLSVRAYDERGMMMGAETVPGRDIEPIIQQFLNDLRVSYLHIHNARPGCFNCQVVRV